MWNPKHTEGIDIEFVCGVSAAAFLYISCSTARLTAMTATRKAVKPSAAQVFLWSLALFFLALVCIPGMPLWVVVPSIVLMQSLNSCTRAFNRAQLINFLPREKIATYMIRAQLNTAPRSGLLNAT